MNKTFSILICVHDRFDKLEKCLASLSAVAEEAEGEVVVVCDGGDPALRETWEERLSIGRSWEARWVTVPKAGPAKARNAVIESLQHDLVLFLNDDVVVEPGLLKAHLAMHDLRPEHAVMGNTRWAPEVIDSEFMHWVAHHDSFYYLIPSPFEATWEYFHTMNLSIHKKWFLEYGLFDESFPDPAFEDTEIGYRFHKKGLKLSLAYDAVLYHVHHFTFEEYLTKSRMRGRSAARFLELYPELEGRILDDYRYQASAGKGLRGFVRKWKRKDQIALWESEISAAFLDGYEEARSSA